MFTNGACLSAPLGETCAAREWDGRAVVGHDGATIGQVACLRLIPEERTAVVLLTNGGESYGLHEDLFPEIVRAVAGVEMPAPVRRPDPPEHVDPTKYLGTYERTGQRSEILLGDQGLVLRTTDTAEVAAGLDREPVHEYPLTPAGDDVFVMPSPQHATWSTATWYEIADGTPYLHVGMRANRKVS